MEFMQSIKTQKKDFDEQNECVQCKSFMNQK